MRLVSLALSVLMFFLAGTVPAVAYDGRTYYGESGYIWPPKDFSSPLGAWDLLTDAQKLETVRDYNLRSAMRWEQMQGGAKTVQEALGASGGARTAAVDSAASQALKSATVGEVAAKAGVTTAEASRRVIDSKLAVDASGLGRFASKFGMSAGELTASLSLASLYLSVGESLPRTHVHADGSPCGGVACANHSEPVYLNPEWGVIDPRLLLPAFDWAVESDSLAWDFPVNYQEMPIRRSPDWWSVAFRPPPHFQENSYSYYGISSTSGMRNGIWSPTIEATKQRLLSVLSSASSPVYHVYQSSNDVGTYASPVLYDQVTGAVSTDARFLVFDSEPSKIVDRPYGPAVYVSSSYTLAQAEAKCAAVEAWLDTVFANPSIVEIEATPDETGTVGPAGPVFPNVPFVGAVSGLDQSGSFDPNVTMDEASDGVTIPDPADVPQPVHDATDTTPEQQEQVQPVDAPFVSGWLAEVLNPILQPVYALFDGLDIFWPFRFMAARG